MGLSDTQLGQVAQEAPNGQTYDDYLKSPATRKAQELSLIQRMIGGQNRTPGGCSDEEFSRLDEEKERYCRKPGTCGPRENLIQPEIMARISNAQNCINARIEIMDRCFDGGDDGHKDQAKERLSGLRKCQNRLTQ